MASSNKIMTQKDADQAIRSAYNDVNTTVGVDGFLVGEVGRKITQTITTTTSSNDTLVFDFYEQSGASHLYQFTIIYTDSTYATMLSATRTL
jgi:hypothetical protein